MFLIPQVLPPELHGAFRLTGVTPHEIVTKLLVCFVSTHYSRFIKLVLLLFHEHLQFRHHLLFLLDVCNIMILVLSQQFLFPQVCVFIPDGHGAQFHVLVHSGEYFVPVAFGSLVSVEVKHQGIENLRFSLHVQFILHTHGASHIQIMLTTELVEREI